MKKFVKMIALSLALLMLAAPMFACSDTGEDTPTDKPTEKETDKMTDKPTEKPTDKPTEKPTEKPEDDKKEEKPLKLDLGENYDMVKAIGRVSYSETGIYCDHSASGIEFTGMMKGNVVLEVETAGVKNGCTTTYFTVYIDGERQAERLSVEPGPRKLKVASFDEMGEHTIKVIKQTESNYTLLEIKSITLEGAIYDPPEDKELYIEFIGDSLTCGMGNIGENSSPNPQTPIWEDATQSYGYMIAEDLDADYSIISQSGIGIAGSWFDPLFDYYTMASYSRYKKDKTFDEEYSFFLHTPDIIVINLGTNDYFLNKDKDPTMCKPEEVQKMTEQFIKHVRDCYGKDIPIVWAYGFVGTFLYDNIKGAIDKLGGEEEGIYMIEVPKNTGGAQGHPTVEGHRAAADKLLPLIKEILGIN